MMAKEWKVCLSRFEPTTADDNQTTIKQLMLVAHVCQRLLDIQEKYWQSLALQARKCLMLHAEVSPGKKLSVLAIPDQATSRWRA